MKKNKSRLNYNKKKLRRLNLPKQQLRQEPNLQQGKLTLKRMLRQLQLKKEVHQLRTKMLPKLLTLIILMFQLHLIIAFMRKASLK
jgi:hypothetical protein